MATFSPESAEKEMRRDEAIHKADPVGYAELQNANRNKNRGRFRKYNSEVPGVNLLPQVKQLADAGLLNTDQGHIPEEKPKSVIVPELPLKTIDVLSQALGKRLPSGSPPPEFRTAVEKKTVNKLLSGKGPHRKTREDVNRIYQHWTTQNSVNTEKGTGPDLEKNPFDEV